MTAFSDSIYDDKVAYLVVKFAALPSTHEVKAALALFGHQKDASTYDLDFTSAFKFKRGTMENPKYQNDDTSFSKVKGGFESRITKQRPYMSIETECEICICEKYSLRVHTVRPLSSM